MTTAPPDGTPGPEGLPPPSEQPSEQPPARRRPDAAPPPPGARPSEPPPGPRPRDAAGAPQGAGSGPPGVRARLATRAEYMMGAQTRAWPPDEVLAWEGFLELHRRLFRDAMALLDREHGLSVSMLGILGRLARAEHHTLSQTALAGAIELSLSRVSRIVDVLEGRGLVERRPCPADGRTTNITLTAEGAAAAEAAQDTVRGFARGRFVSRLSEAEIATLAAAFLRLAGPEEDKG